MTKNLLCFLDYQDVWSLTLKTAQFGAFPPSRASAILRPCSTSSAVMNKTWTIPPDLPSALRLLRSSPQTVWHPGTPPYEWTASSTSLPSSSTSFSSTDRIAYTSSRYEHVVAWEVVGSETVTVGKDALLRRELIGWKWASTWNAPGTKTMVGLGWWASDASMKPTGFLPVTT